MVTGYPQPGERFGRYDIVRRIGRGGMGVVYAAVHRDLQRDVALKLLSQDLAETQDYRKRFVREAQTLARLDSPHIVRVYDAGEQDGWLFIATELIADGDLGDLLRAEGALPVDQALDVFHQVAEGLADAHAAGILHRDIKPSNVLIKRSADGSVRAILCDLGISAVLDAEHTKTIGVVGTLAYMAPERHEGADASVATDIYALGCLLWAVLTGTSPYVGSDFQVASAHIREPGPQLPAGDSRAEVINPALAALMAKLPDARPKSARQVVAMFQESTLTRCAVDPVKAEARDECTVVRQDLTLDQTVTQDGTATVSVEQRRPQRRRALVIAGVVSSLVITACAVALLRHPAVLPPDEAARHVFPRFTDAACSEVGFDSDGRDRGIRHVWSCPKWPREDLPAGVSIDSVFLIDYASMTDCANDESRETPGSIWAAGVISHWTAFGCKETTHWGAVINVVGKATQAQIDTLLTPGSTLLGTVGLT